VIAEYVTVRYELAGGVGVSLQVRADTEKATDYPMPLEERTDLWGHLRVSRVIEGKIQPALPAPSCRRAERPRQEPGNSFATKVRHLSSIRSTYLQ